MGMAKNYWMEQLENGYYYVNKNVCSTCVDDLDLKKRVIKNGIIKTCSYCNKRRKCFEVDDIIEIIIEAIKEYYDELNTVGVPWSSDEEGNATSVLDTDEVLNEIGYPDNNVDLRSDICDAFRDRQWTRVTDYFPQESIKLKYSWDTFANITKYERRYTFLGFKDSDYSEFIPKVLLKAIQNIIISLNIINVFGDIDIYRCRNANKTYKTAKDLGSPPTQASKYPNRMSPSGISMFYGSFDEITSIKEIYCKDKEKLYYNFGVFTPNRPMKILDLSKLPKIPGLFSESNELREPILFMKMFSDEISKTILKDGREHIEYVPSQIFTEYVRYYFKDYGNKNIDGIIYNSSITQKQCIVIFIDNDHCKDQNKSKLSENELILKKTYHYKRSSTYIKKVINGI